MISLKTDKLLDVKGLSCPMPVVKAKKAMNDLGAGQILEVQATDKGSKADIKLWAERAGHQYIGLIEEGAVLKHYIRKLSDKEKMEIKHPNIIQNDELLAKMVQEHQIVILDVREYAEFAFEHIPNALSIPLGELEERMSELEKEDQVFVVCRTGNRSDLSAQFLAENGFKNVFNVLPGMSQWTGALEGINH